MSYHKTLLINAILLVGLLHNNKNDCMWSAYLLFASSLHAIISAAVQSTAFYFRQTSTLLNSMVQFLNGFGFFRTGICFICFCWTKTASKSETHQTKIVLTQKESIYTTTKFYQSKESNSWFNKPLARSKLAHVLSYEFLSFFNRLSHWLVTCFRENED